MKNEIKYREVLAGMPLHEEIIKDLTEAYPDMPIYILNDPPEIYSNPEDLDEAIRFMDYWKGKYFELMEKYVALIEEKMEREKK